MSNTESLEWMCRERTVRIGERPLLMGILNVTPDSFSDGGLHFDRERALARGLEMAAEGADLIDVGGESTRPGAEEVSEEEERRRVLPVIAALAGRTGALISVDTQKAAVARAALEAGAHVVNDVSALTRDAEMAAVVRRARAGVVLMHMRGTPRTMQAAPRYTDVVEEVSRYLAARCAELTDRGLDARQLAVDPGIGFGKTADHNLQLLAHLHRVAACGRPVVIGLSRKSFLGTLTGHPVAERLAASVAALTFCVLGGAHVVRVHDVAAAWDAVRVALALARARRGEPGGVEQS